VFLLGRETRKVWSRLVVDLLATGHYKGLVVWIVARHRGYALALALEGLLGGLSIRRNLRPNHMTIHLSLLLTHSNYLISTSNTFNHISIHWLRSMRIINNRSMISKVHTLPTRIYRISISPIRWVILQYLCLCLLILLHLLKALLLRPTFFSLFGGGTLGVACHLTR